MTEEAPLYSVHNVTKDFARGRRRSVRPALSEVSLVIRRGEGFGIVGESGSGKTTLGRLLVGFDTPTEGEIVFEGRAVVGMKRAQRRSFRQGVQMVFQNPFASLNPFRSIRDTLSDGYAHRRMSSGERDTAMKDLLGLVGLHESMLDRYPHEFSGGQRQRIVLARALSVNPSVLVADEPVSALDVSIQAQVLNLLNTLKKTLGLTVIMVTHDLRVVNFFCDRIAVMYMGRLVEVGDRDTIMNESSHPYTRMLISAAPNGDPEERSERPWVSSELAASEPPAEGCIFAPRCWLRQQLGNPEECVTTQPRARPLLDGPAPDEAHLAACHFAEDVPEQARLAQVS
ncbi:oligopeptide/dipeptide ABC transporter ATP-binding protein [Cryobacterium tagatosivorans]|nr:oligopeptide/dipeptide ABC transporter ATP-binding protein [Cryobacterium tagatosivorans]